MPSLKQNESAAIVLRKAKELIETKGWTKGAYGRIGKRDAGERLETLREATCFCMYGALTVAGGFLVVRTAEQSVAAKLLEEVTGAPALNDWQDKRLRTETEVLSAFDRAIDLAESRS